MKKEIYREEDYKKIKKKWKIKKINPKIVFSLKKFIRNGLIIGHWNFNSIYKSINEKSDFAIITGFSISGRLHMSNKQPLDVAMSLKQNRGKIFIPVSDTEAILTRKSPKDINEEFRIFLRDLIKIGIDIKNTNIYLHSTNKKIQSFLLKIIKSLKISDFKNIYGGDIDLPSIFAISNMMADIFYPFEKGYKRIIVILGIDEIKHAQLAGLLSDKIGFPKPSFLFLKVLRGLKGNKMSKSKIEENILISDKPRIAKNKLIKFCIKRRFKNKYDELPYQIAMWHLNISKSKLNKLSKNLSYNEFVKYIANGLERYFKNGFK